MEIDGYSIDIPMIFHGFSMVFHGFPVPNGSHIWIYMVDSPKLCLLTGSILTWVIPVFQTRVVGSTTQEFAAFHVLLCPYSSHSSMLTIACWALDW